MDRDGFHDLDGLSGVMKQDVRGKEGIYVMACVLCSVSLASFASFELCRSAVCV